MPWRYQIEQLPDGMALACLNRRQEGLFSRGDAKPEPP
jgi:hypothetical protein